MYIIIWIRSQKTTQLPHSMISFIHYTSIKKNALSNIGVLHSILKIFSQRVDLVTDKSGESGDCRL